MSENNLFKNWRSLASVLTIIVIIVADLLTKNWIRTFPLDSEIARWSFIRIIYIQNMGSSFGMFQGQATPLKIIAIVSLCVFILVGIFIFKRYRNLVTLWNALAYGLIVGGTTGNLIDRLRFGKVTDFIDPGFWPVFNVADSAISVGAVMVAISLLRRAITERK